MHYQLLQLTPELQAFRVHQLGAPDSSEKPLEIIGNPCISCDPDLSEHHPDQDRCDETLGNDGYSETLEILGKSTFPAIRDAGGTNRKR